MNITVLGQGHLGTVVAGGLALAGHRVSGVDIDRGRISGLKAGRSPLYEPGLETWLRHGMENRNIQFMHRDELKTGLGDVVVIALGTPASENGAADLSQVSSALEWLRTFDLEDVVLVMKSTVPPGTGQRILREELRGTGVRYVANPEFLREGRALEDWRSPQRIVIGTDPGDRLSIRAMERMYSGIKAPFLFTDISSAEMIKYASNAFLATRISFINEIASICDLVGASVDAVGQGMAMDARVGSVAQAGIGYGGSCFPKDIRALGHLAYNAGLDLPLLKSVANVNEGQRLLPVHALRRRFAQQMHRQTVAVLGLAFKPDTDDIREAPSLDIIESLVREGVAVRAFDPRANESACHLLPSDVAFFDTPAQACRGAHAAVLLTEWNDIVDADWRSIALSMRRPRYIFDGRNCLDPGAMAEMGFQYEGIGRMGPRVSNRVRAVQPLTS